VLLFTSPLSRSQDKPHPKFRIGAELLSGAKSSCPVFIGHVPRNSPAAKAGLQPGDRLLSVDGKVVESISQAAQLVTSDARTSVVIEIFRAGRRSSVTAQREDDTEIMRQQGLKALPDGILIRANATDSEIEYQRRMIRTFESGSGNYSVAFPDAHYPTDKEIYYPGFEVFILKNENLAIVGGIEDGPASRAHMRWGDQILAINGMDTRGKSAAEVESALSRSKPDSIALKLARGAAPFAASFVLEKASDVLRENEKKVLNGRIVPIWLSDEYLNCWQ